MALSRLSIAAAVIVGVVLLAIGLIHETLDLNAPNPPLRGSVPENSSSTGVPRHSQGAGLAINAAHLNPPTSAKQVDASANEEPPVSVDNQKRLSVNVDKLPLKLVLLHIAERAGISIDTSRLGVESAVTLRFTELSLEEGLRRLLGKHDAFFFYEAQTSEPATLKAVWVYTKGRGKMVSPDGATITAAMMDQILINPDVQFRATAVEDWVDRKGTQSTDVVMKALKDKDSEVRNRSLFKALSAGVRVPPDFLSQIALADPSPEVRVLALQALAFDANAAKMVAATLMNNDSHETVREFARGVFEQPIEEPTN